MSAEKLNAIALLTSGLILLGFAAITFFLSKGQLKRFLRISLSENPTREDEYRMLRSLVAFLVIGSFFIFFSVWGFIRLLNAEQWVYAIGAS